MHLNHPNLARAYTCLSVDQIGSPLTHIRTTQLDQTIVVEGTALVGSEGDGNDLDGLVLQAVLNNKLLRGQDGACSAIRGGAALQFSERTIDLVRFLDLLQGVLIPELGVRVIDGVEVVLVGYLSKMFFLSAVPK